MKRSPPTTKPNKSEFLILLAIFALGLLLRFWQLDSKPLWVDEVITSIFSLGLGFDDIPTAQVIPVEAIASLFQYNPTSCPEIAARLASQSTHPPLFFCLLHTWLGWVGVENLAWATRSFAALWGGGAILAIYWLNRGAFSVRAGLTGAALMAISPFAVYLSQEARHYTLPLVFLTLALAAQVKVQQQLMAKKSPLLGWVLWGGMSALALFSHYFCLLAIVAQLLTLGLFWGRSRPPVSWLTLPQGFALYLLPYLFLIPWWPAFWGHFNSPTTGWLSPPTGLAPLGQTVASWVVMLFVPPVEGQPMMVQGAIALLSLAILAILIQQTRQGWQALEPSMERLTLSAVVVFVVIEYFALIYGLGKDISIAPRYHFVYFPAVCALLGAAWGEQSRRFQGFAAAVLILSSLCVVYNLAFQKPYLPDQVAAQFDQDPRPVMVMMAYRNTLEMAVGLSYGLALGERRPPEQKAEFALLSYEQSYEQVWTTLATFPIQPVSLWAIAPGYLDDAFPETVALTLDQSCQIDPDQFYRLGFPYQRYQCHDNS